MIRHISAVVLTLVLFPASLLAQATLVTVSVDSASIYKTPSTGSPVIGHAPRGTAMHVVRELGSWIRVTWPSGPEGVGYVHVSMISHAAARTAERGVESSVPQPVTQSVSAPAAPQAPPAPIQRRASDRPLQLPASGYVPAPIHSVGLGARVGFSQRTYGGSARLWSRDHLGVQLEASRGVLTSAVSASQLTSMQFAPSVLWSLRDRTRDYVSLRPYVGGGATIVDQTLGSAVPGGVGTSDKSVGFQVFGGSEATFVALPQFALSADAGYRRIQTVFPDFEPSKFVLSIAGHWYIK